METKMNYFMELDKIRKRMIEVNKGIITGNAVSSLNAAEQYEKQLIKASELLYPKDIEREHKILMEFFKLWSKSTVLLNLEVNTEKIAELKKQQMKLQDSICQTLEKIRLKLIDEESL
ncbi:hypothetical protein D1B33_08935 [Lysinibacillus yapensis]|uniref:Uncharacterized protein n=1 Tax=Ureibacillus yapensis TaxID=2304605 RepID=A0A396S955_9BACL|nr:hypothetical protein [Lysinibacillus yapensis]RHW37639.1 hypothetical protein D1B33_08935 [Lysinibacillus yapensis]